MHGTGAPDPGYGRGPSHDGGGAEARARPRGRPPEAEREESARDPDDPEVEERGAYSEGESRWDRVASLAGIAPVQGLAVTEQFVERDQLLGPEVVGVAPVLEPAPHLRYRPTVSSQLSRRSISRQSAKSFVRTRVYDRAARQFLPRLHHPPQKAHPARAFQERGAVETLGS